MFALTLFPDNSFGRYTEVTPCSPTIAYKGLAYFCGKHKTLGRELFQTDGTPGGTFVIKDIDVGPGSSEPRDFFILNGLLYFFAETAVTGHELYVTDGTEDFTKLIRDAIPGPDGLDDVDTYPLIVGNGEAFFYEGASVWRTDGSYDGTFNISMNLPAGVDISLHGAAYISQNLLFVTYGAESKLYSYSSTSQTLTTLADKSLVPCNDTDNFSIEISSDTAIDGGIVFNASCNNLHYIGHSDGSVRGTEIIGTAFNNHLFGFGPINSNVLFCESNTGHLYKTDGTAISKFWHNSEIPVAANACLGIRGNNYKAGGRLVFRYATTNYGAELWATDGTSKGTKLLKDITPGDKFTSLGYRGNLGGKAVFVITKEGLWANDNVLITDGTTDGTIELTTGSGKFINGTSAVRTTSTHVIWKSSNLQYTELWSSTGTKSSNTLLLRVPGSIRDQRVEDQRLYFNYHNSLWHTDGFKSGTYAVKYLLPEQPEPPTKGPLVFFPAIYLLLESD